MPRTTRRPSTLLTATAALVLTGALGAGQPVADATAPAPGGGPDLRLAGPPGEVVRSATVRLDADRLHPARGGARTDRLTHGGVLDGRLHLARTDPDVALRTRTGRDVERRGGTPTS